VECLEYFDNEAQDFEEPNSLELAKIGADIQKLIKQQQEEELLNSGQLEQPVEQPKSEDPKAADQQKRGQSEVRFVDRQINDSVVSLSSLWNRMQKSSKMLNTWIREHQFRRLMDDKQETISTTALITCFSSASLFDKNSLGQLNYGRN
jgi:hypothetical protein